MTHCWKYNQLDSAKLKSQTKADSLRYRLFISLKSWIKNAVNQTDSCIIIGIS
jgi:hypothetical protein